MDVQMAGMDGFTLVETIKADSAVAGTPLLPFDRFRTQIERADEFDVLR